MVFCFTNQKKKYKNMFFQAFKDLNSDLLRIAISGLQDWDNSHNTKKLEKYLTRAIIQEKQEHKEEGKKLITNIMDDFFEEKQKKIKTPSPKFKILKVKPKMIDKAIQKDPDLIEQKLNEIERKKIDILYRKELIKQKKKAERKNKTGKLG